MSDAKITQLSENTNPQLTDLVVGVQAPATSPVTVKMTLTDIFSALGYGIPAGTTTDAPIVFNSGTNLTTAAAGAIEFDGSAFYATAIANTRQVINAEQFCQLTSDYTLTSSTSPQKAFNASSNGAVTLAGSTLYFFECFLYLTGMSATSGNFTFEFGGTATFTSCLWQAYGMDSTTPTTAAAVGGSLSTSATGSGNITTAATGTGAFVLIKGIMRINAGGTIIPEIALTTAATAAVKAGSYFRIWAMGAAATTTVGDWS